jgi:ankyrin repeat protein
MPRNKFVKILLLLWTGFLFGAGSQAEPLIVDTAKASNWVLLETLMATGSDVNAVFADGTSALHWASYRDNSVMASLLIEAGANVNATTDLGVTPLWLAAQNGSASMVQTLVTAGADPDVNLLLGESAVMIAARSGDATVVELLLKAGANPNVSATRGQTALMWAAGQGYASIVEALLEYNADVHTRTEVQSLLMKTDKEQYSNPDFRGNYKSGGNDALMFAVRSGHLSSATLLVSAGSNVNEISASGVSPLIEAVHGGNAKIVQLLAENGADLNASAPGYTALHAAVLRRNYPALEVLLALGADTELRVEKATPTRRQSLDFHFHETFVGATPLWLAARFTEPDMMRVLLEFGADPHFMHNVRYPAGGGGGRGVRRAPFQMADEGEVSVLMAAVGMGNRRLDRVSKMGRSDRDFLDSSARELLTLESVTVAIDAGGDPNLRDASNRSALDAANSLRYESVVSVLSKLTRNQ